MYLLIALARHRPFATFLPFADRKGHHYVDGLLISIIFPDSTYSTYRNYLNVMKTSFTAAASTPTTTTTTIPTAPQQQVATSPSPLDGLLVYAPLLAVLGLGSIIAALITRDGQWQIYRDNKEQEKEIESNVQTTKNINEIVIYWQNYLANNGLNHRFGHSGRMACLISKVSSMRDRALRHLVQMNYSVHGQS